MKICKLACPCCKQYMTMEEVGDSVKELKCRDCGVIKTFKSWEEQKAYEKAYDKSSHKS